MYNIFYVYIYMYIYIYIYGSFSFVTSQLFTRIFLQTHTPLALKISVPAFVWLYFSNLDLFALMSLWFSF